ncbi:MAG: hypothetical protein QOI38_2955 [Sphingomonadales bacterium]|nr:hypothetical protein [Sphingomonadales bacterium]
MQAKSTILWLLPAAFVLHDAEEAATMADWLARNGGRLPPALRSLFDGGEAAMLAAMAALFLLLVAGTAWATFSRGRAELLVYATLLGGFFVHGFGHLGQALLFGGYTPGVATALVVVIPASIALYARLRRMGLDRRTLLLTGAAGALLVGPGILLAWAIGRGFG